MSYTENLELKIVDNTDDFHEAFTQGNYNASKLEQKIGGLLDDLESLPGIMTDITNLQGDVGTLQGETSSLDNRLDTAEDIITDIIAGKGTIVDEEGNVITGTYKTYYVEVTATGSQSVAVIPGTDTEHRTAIYSTDGTVSINARNLAGITSVTNVRVINATCMINEYRTDNYPTNARFTFAGLYKPPYNEDYYFVFTAENTKIIEQTHNAVSDTWVPAPSDRYQDKTCKVAITYFVAD